MVALAQLLAGHALADQILLPASSFERSGKVQVIYRLEKPETGRGVLRYLWTDALGRHVQQERIPVLLTGRREFAFSLDLRRAAGMANQVTVQLTSEDASQPSRGAKVSFIARPPGHPFADWQLIIYQDETPAALATLKRIGVTAGRVFANRDDAAPTSVDAAIAPFLAQDLRWYVENIATDFYSAYHRWRPDLPVNATFLAAQRLHARNPRDLAAFMRVPSLSDPAWLHRVRSRLIRTVGDYAAYRPLYYSLADEPGIADLAAAWDFDLSPPSLRAMRAWLARRYGSLAALNREWGSRFIRWRDVVPRTTDQAMQAPGDNFAAWADFKAWMDVAFARALRAGTEAVHAADPHALAAIEGGQVPGWGGYDYARLPGSVDAMELYDAGGNIDILHSLRPSAIMLMTLTGGGAEQMRALWRGVLRGMRGAILWDETHDLVRQDGTLGTWGHTVAPIFAELRNGLGALLANGTHQNGQVALLYSPASQRTQWMLDHRPLGAAWAQLGAEAEYQDNASRRARRRFASAVTRAGLQPFYLSPQMVEGGALRGRIRVLLLPDVLALSAHEADEIRRFVAGGGTVFADVVPGAFDQHSRRRPRPALDDLFRTAGPGRGQAVLVSPATDLTTLLPAPEPRLTQTDGNAARDVEVYHYRTGPITLLALLRALAPAAQADGRNAKEQVMLHLRRRYFVYDVRGRRELGRTDRPVIPLDPQEPTILALSATRLAVPVSDGPTRVAAGRIATFTIRLPGRVSPDPSPVHVSVSGPDGSIMPAYSGNLLIRRGQGVWHVPIALNDPPGRWRIEFTDVTSGQNTARAFAVPKR